MIPIQRQLYLLLRLPMLRANSSLTRARISARLYEKIAARIHQRTASWSHGCYDAGCPCTWAIVRWPSISEPSAILMLSNAGYRGFQSNAHNKSTGAWVSANCHRLLLRCGSDCLGTTFLSNLGAVSSHQRPDPDRMYSADDAASIQGVPLERRFKTSRAKHATHSAMRPPPICGDYTRTPSDTEVYRKIEDPVGSNG